MAVNEADILNGLNIGTDATSLFSNTPEDPLVKVTQNFLQSGIDRMREILQENGRNVSSTLLQSLEPTPMQNTANGFEIGVKGVDYAEFVDKGVNASGDPFTTPNNGHPIVNNALPNDQGEIYKFKQGGYVARSFVEAIEKWIPAKPTGFPPSTQVAFAVAKNIKKRGIEPTNFIGGAFDQNAIDQFTGAVAEIMNQSINLQIKGILK